MVFRGVVYKGVVQLPLEADLPDGTEVEVTASDRKRFADLLDLAGTWTGDDADTIVDELYRARSSAPDRASLD